MTSTLYKNLWIVSQNAKRDIFYGDIFVEGNIFKRIGKISEDADNVIDCKGNVAIPGFINTHAHVAMSNMKGIADDMHFDKFLETTFKYDSNRTEEEVEENALYGMAEMLLNGITTFADLYYFENAIVKSAIKANIRVHAAWAILDQEYTTQKGNPVDNCRAFIENVKENPNELVTPVVGVQGIYVANEETLHKARELATQYNTYIHMHLSETRKEVTDCVSKYGKRPVEWLDKIGFLDENTLAAHSVWLTDKELQIYSQRKVKVSHCPSSNMKLAVGGIAPIPEMIHNNVVVSLGTDSVVSNNSLSMLWEMKLSSLLHKLSKWDATVVSAQTSFDMATINGAKALKMDQEIGSIEEGKKADFIILDKTNIAFYPFSKERIISSIVYSADRSAIKEVIVNGKTSVKEGRIISFNSPFT